ncbi:MAG: cbb3-type cytochrome c oxidase subunit 3 [Burkholderiales bacterium]
MDIDVLRSIMTVVSFVTFIGIVVWAWSGKAGRAFEEAARLPFEEDNGAVQRGREMRR